MPATPFITDQALLSAIEGLLKVPKSSVGFNAPYWVGIVADANQAATNEIYGQLAARGFLAAQIAAWDRRQEFAKAIGLWWALTMGAALAGYDDKFVKALDRRKELETVQVLINNVFQNPQGPPLSVSVGEFDNSGDLFGAPTDPDDPRLGEVVRF